MSTDAFVVTVYDPELECISEVREFQDHGDAMNFEEMAGCAGFIASTQYPLSYELWMDARMEAEQEAEDERLEYLRETGGFDEEFGVAVSDELTLSDIPF